jgi:Flp pilus assembly protein TadG
MMSKQSVKRKFKDRGQAVVEFALVMVFFLMILLAVLDLGRAYLSVVALENAAAEGALYGSANPTCLAQGDCGDPQNSIDYRVRHESVGGLLDPSAMLVDWTDSPVIGGQLAVTVTYPYHPIIPLLSAAGADPIWLSSSAIEMIP